MFPSMVSFWDGNDFGFQKKYVQVISEICEIENTNVKKKIEVKINYVPWILPDIVVGTCFSGKENSIKKYLI